jgi:hypothetical protein
MTTAAAPRSRTRRTADVVVGVLLALFALAVAFAFYVQYFTLRDPAGTLASNCTASGAVCDQGLLDAICYIGYAVCLFGFAIPVGFMVVRFVQNRLAWFFPLISVAVIIIGFYVLLAILGRGYGV